MDLDKTRSLKRNNTSKWSLDIQMSKEPINHIMLTVAQKATTLWAVSAALFKGSQWSTNFTLFGTQCKNFSKRYSHACKKEIFSMCPCLWTCNTTGVTSWLGIVAWRCTVTRLVGPGVQLENLWTIFSPVYAPINRRCLWKHWTFSSAWCLVFKQWNHSLMVHLGMTTGSA